MTTGLTVGVSLASFAFWGAFWGMSIPCAAQDFGGRELREAMAKIEQMRREGKPIPPAPRLKDGHIDLGNEGGSWWAPNIGDMAGADKGTGGQTAGAGGGARPEKTVEVAFLPWDAHGERSFSHPADGQQTTARRRRH